MKQKYLQIVGSFLLGMVVPWVFMPLGAVIQPQQPSVETTFVTETAPTEGTSEIMISVLLSSGETVQMELEAYVVGVVLAEMPTSYTLAALEAQATVARTYAMKRQRELRHPMGAVCTYFGCCQAYISPEDYLNGLGYQEDIDKTVLAVTATKGQVLTYNSQLIEATYFSCSGGRTEDAIAVWGVEYPYLQAVESPGEENMDGYIAQVYFTIEQVEEKLGRTLSGSPKSWLGWTTYTAGGGVASIDFAGEQYSGTEMRRLLQLNSTAFHMEADDDGLWVTTKGKGHRVGMSQSGAEVMALEGSSCETILSHYYPGTRIDKLTDLQ